MCTLENIVFYYHLIYGTGVLKKRKDSSLSIVFWDNETPFTKSFEETSIGKHIFKSKEELILSLGKRWSIPRSAIQEIVNNELPPHKILLRYKGIIRAVLEKGLTNDYSFIFDTLDWMYHKSYLTHNTALSNDLIDEILDGFQKNRAFRYGRLLVIKHGNPDQKEKMLKEIGEQHRKKLIHSIQPLQSSPELKASYRHFFKILEQPVPYLGSSRNISELKITLLEYIRNLPDHLYQSFYSDLPSLPAFIHHMLKEEYTTLYPLLCEICWKSRNLPNADRLIDLLIQIAREHPRFRNILEIYVDLETWQLRNAPMSEADLNWIRTYRHLCLLNQELSKSFKAHNIKNLIHFTPIKNLENIYKYGGLYSRRMLSSKNISFNRTDTNRFDGQTQAISLSITYPNCKMLLQKSDIDIAVLVLNPRFLFHRFDPKTFYPTNAAYQSGTAKHGNDLDTFESMFGKCVISKSGVINRSDALPPEYATDCQAEILYEGKIEFSEILEIHVSNQSAYNYICANVPEIASMVQINSYYFDYNIVRQIWGDSI